MDSLSQYLFKVTISFVAPVLTQAAGAIGHGIDSAALYDCAGVPALPGSLMQGNLRHCWGGFVDKSSLTQDMVDDWLGKASVTAGIPQRGRLIFNEYWRSATACDDSAVVHRIKIERDKAKVERGALQIISSPYKADKKVVFTGGIVAWLKDKDEANELKKWLTKGLQYIPAMGGLKGVGFGRINAVEEVSYKCVDCSKAVVTKVATCYGLIDN